jgi:hypothetical protein
MEIVACVSLGEPSDALLQFRAVSMRHYLVATFPSTLGTDEKMAAATARSIRHDGCHFEGALAADRL